MQHDNLLFCWQACSCLLSWIPLLQALALTRYITVTVVYTAEHVHCVVTAVKDDAELPAYVGDGLGHVMQEAQMPLTESLQDTVKRILPLWHDSIAPAVRSGQRVLIVAHGNSIRVSS